MVLPWKSQLMQTSNLFMKLMQYLTKTTFKCNTHFDKSFEYFSITKIIFY